jgi:hypothetical protein
LECALREVVSADVQIHKSHDLVGSGFASDVTNRFKSLYRMQSHPERLSPSIPSYEQIASENSSFSA